MQKKSLLLAVLLTSLTLMSACGAEPTGKTSNPQDKTNVEIDNSQNDSKGDVQRGTLEDALKDALLNKAEDNDGQVLNGQSNNNQSDNNQSSNSSNIDNINTPYTNAKVTYTIPEEFIETSANSNFYYSSNYPTDTSNINVISLANDTQSLLMEADDYKQLMEEMYLTQYNVEVDMQIDTFKKIKLDGYDALIIETSYNLGGIDLVQHQITVQVGESTTSITCTQASDNDWAATFDEVIDSVHVEQ